MGSVVSQPIVQASLVAQLVKSLPAVRETWVPSLGGENSPGEGKGYPLQGSGLETSVGWVVHGVTKSWTRLSNFHFFFAQITPRGENTLPKGQRALGRLAGQCVGSPGPGAGKRAT